MEALRRSIAQEKATPTPPKKGRKRIEGQGEILFPISGKKGKQATAKPAERASARQENAGYFRADISKTRQRRRSE
jgi:hypothetical protein